ncbi:hypothetical protein ACPEER_03125 [Pasteurella sp. PK-2025]|uniref:hypothetical protein n=1 Tax=Pasteurella sp. PK-2025 TaxID=3413133 RepID=UPI003C78A099
MENAITQAGKSIAMRWAYVGENITTKIKNKFSKKTIHKFSISKEQLSKDTIKKDNLMETEGGEFIGKNAPDFLKKGKIKIKTEVRR